MKKTFLLRLTAFLVVAGTLAGLFLTTDVYEETRSRIVEVLCLSCIKLEPKTVANFTFNTVNNVSHQPFIIENLTHGPIFIDYSENACDACTQMHPIVARLFNVSFGEKEMFYAHVLFEQSNVTVMYINIDNTTVERKNSRPIYDKDHIGGLPQFTIITLGNYDHGIVKPYYTSVYGLLNKPSDEQRYTFLRDLMEESIEMYNQNQAGFHP